MTLIKNWSTTAANNNDTPPYGAPENGTNVNQVNNILRQIMAEVRSWFETPQWRDLGHTPTYASSSSFTIAGDKTASYIVGQRIKVNDLTTLYGTIASSSYSSPNTTVGVTLDSGSISSDIESVEVGIDPTNKPIPYAALSGSLSSNAVATASIQDDAVTLAKQASGTANRLQGFDGSGNPSEITVSGVSLSAGALSLPNSGVTAASYTSANITVDAQGRVTAASNGGASIFTSNDITPSATGSGSAAHGLGANPRMIWFEVYCQNTANGYTAGQIFNIMSSNDDTTNATGCVAYADSTNVYWKIASGSNFLVFLNPSTGNKLPVSSSNAGDFRLRVKAMA